MTGATPLWTGTEAGAALGADGPTGWTATGVSIDSRTLAPGDLFVAIQGPNADGHDFIGEAFGAGAAAVLAADDWAGTAPGAVVRVPDTLEGLVALGRAARARMTGKVAAVTGSVGKTGVKSALAAALGRYRATHSSAASHNNLWGVPLSLARMGVESRYGVFEIGMNHAEEIRPLTGQVRPHLAIVTTVEPVHLEFFDSVAAIADAKAEIFDGFEPGGIAVLNRDNAHFDRLAERARAAGAERIIAFGESDRADARLIKAVPQADCSCVSADICGQAMTFKIGIPGRHWVQNSLAVLAAVQALGGDLGLAGLALAQLEPPPGRGRRFHLHFGHGAVELIDESYNANPASMGSAIAALGDTPVPRRGRRIAILGDMRELGPDSPAFHAALAEPLATAKIDLVMTVGPDMAHLHEALPGALRGAHAETADALAPRAAAAVRAGDAVMVKGSLASGMAAVVSALRALGGPDQDQPARRANGRKG